MELQGKVALVTGGARRLGRAFVDGLAREGMRLAVHYGSSSKAADQAVAELRVQGVDAVAFGADLTDADQLLALPGRVAEHFGQLDLLVNSAAVMEQISLADTRVAQWDRIIDLNLRAPFFLAQQAAPLLAKQRGKIINIADLGGLQPWPGYPVHSISKSGVVMLTKLLALILAPEVTVNAIAPGTVMVPDSFGDARREFLVQKTPMGRLGKAEDAVEALLFLARCGDFITGEVLAVDGGRLLRS